MIKAVFFDLDGTLLPMHMNEFVSAYMKALAEKMGALGLDAKKLIDVLWKGTEAMVKNDGSVTNEKRFWQVYEQEMGTEMLRYQPDFEAFYRHEYDKAKEKAYPTPQAAELVQFCKDRGLAMVIATNPVFPEVAQQKRIAWAGLNPEDFMYITTYENSHYCKPNPAYFQEILDRTGLTAQQVVMIGNDALEDTAAGKLGIPVFLLTDYLWNEHHVSIDKYPQWSFEEAKQFIEAQLHA